MINEPIHRPLQLGAITSEPVFKLRQTDFKILNSSLMQSLLKIGIFPSRCVTLGSADAVLYPQQLVSTREGTKRIHLTISFSKRVIQLSEQCGCSNSNYLTKTHHNSVTEKRLISIKIISLWSPKYTKPKTLFRLVKH